MLFKKKNNDEQITGGDEASYNAAESEGMEDHEVEVPVVDNSKKKTLFYVIVAAVGVVFVVIGYNTFFAKSQNTAVVSETASENIVPMGDSAITLNDTAMVSGSDAAGVPNFLSESQNTNTVAPSDVANLPSMPAIAQPSPLANVSNPSAGIERVAVSNLAPSAPLSAPANVAINTSAETQKISSRVDDLDVKIKEISAKLSELENLRDSLARIEQKLSMASTSVTISQPTASEASANASVAAPVVKKVVKKAVNPWVLKSVAGDSAWIADKKGKNFQKVTVGMTVKGLGKITSIKEKKGKWVIQGTKGRVVQK